MDVLPVREFRRLDLNSEEQGVPVARLMEKGGRGLAAAARMADQGPRPDGPVLFLCGKGNNGGDGLAAAAMLLDEGRDVEVVLMAGPAKVKGPARSWLRRLPKERVSTWRRALPRWRGAALAVDCLLGSGIRGPPRPPHDRAIRWLRGFDGPVLSCDIPSGLGTALAVVPDRTVTFHAAKEGMDAANSGTIEVVDIGIPRRAADIGIGDLDAGYVRPRGEGHKGQHGRVLVVGGGPFTGAPYYAAMAAARTGADLVHIATPADAARVIACWGPEPIVHATNPGTYLDGIGTAAVEELLGLADTVLVGPGLGREPVTREAVRTVLLAAADAGLSVVVDADGLDALDAHVMERLAGRLVVTPHAREFQDMAGRKATPGNVRAFAAAHGITVLRKGKADQVTDGERDRRCPRGHPMMTVGGTGDALAGAVACLMAKGADAFDAACAGSYILGVAGEQAAALRSYGSTTSDVIEAIPSVLLRLGD